MSSRAVRFPNSFFPVLILREQKVFWIIKDRKRNISYRNEISKRLERLGEKTKSLIRLSWLSPSLSQFSIWNHVEILGNLDLSFRKAMVLGLKCCMWAVFTLELTLTHFQFPHNKNNSPTSNLYFYFLFSICPIFFFKLFKQAENWAVMDLSWCPKCSERDRRGLW